MKRDKKSVIFIFVLVGLVTLFLFMFYGKVIMNPNFFLFNFKGDGTKNYYTYVNYIENNISNTNFEGMNYPYGENFMYTDCHPFLSFLMKFLTYHFPLFSNYSIGILNFLLILSIGITAFIIYFIFRELKINYILAVLGAVGITILNPQIFRITGHYALSYSFFIPLTIYLLLLYEKGIKRKMHFFFLTISILFFFFTHAYLGIIASTMIITYVFISIINQFIIEKKINFSKNFLLLVAAILPIVFFYLFIKIIDTHVGRTTNPWGIFENHADFSTVFLPVFNSLNKIKEFIFPGLKQPWEGWAYIGFFTTIGLIFYLVVSIKTSIKRKRIVLDNIWINHLTLRQLFISSIIILLFSMFYPFRIYMEELVNYFSIIKQFRALGRFAWVFYFVSTITLICIVNQAYYKLKKNNKKIIGYFLIVIIPLSLIYEGMEYHIYFSKEMTQSPNLFDINQTSKTFAEDVKVINSDEYQAILPFPFFYKGSENFGIDPNDRISQLSFLFSYHLNLPIIGSYLTRTSICESKNIMQLLASNFYYKKIQNDLPNDKPFLLLCLNNHLNTTETNYLKKAKSLIKRDEYNIYEINIDAFFKNTATEEIEHFNKIKDRLFEKDGFLVSDTSLYFSFIDFEQPNSDISFSGENGCYKGLQKNYNQIFSIKKGQLDLNKKYTIRFWMYNDGENCGQDCLGGMIIIQKKSDEKLEWLKPIVNAGNSHEINDKWSLVEISFDHTDEEAIYDLLLKGSNFSEKTIFLDDLLFYDNELVIYKVFKANNKITLFKNNHKIETPVN